MLKYFFDLVLHSLKVWCILTVDCEIFVKKEVCSLKTEYLKRLTAAVVAGLFAFSFSNGEGAERIHNSKNLTKAEVNRQLYGSNAKTGYTTNVKTQRDATSAYGRDNKQQSRVGSILRPEKTKEAESETLPKFDNSRVNYFYVPKTNSPYDSSIIGTPMASQKQCVKYLLNNNPNPRLSVSAEEIVAYYYEEGTREGIRPDVAFAQALKETGFFRYGGDVVPEQNNYCGLGTTGGGVRGVYFDSPQLGVRAHIQHLLAYSSTRKPTLTVVDPRYELVRKAYGSRTLDAWSDLNGRWAVPGNRYGQEILSIFNAILVQ